MLALMVLALVAQFGAAEPGIRVVIRATARTSFALFMLAFAASSLRRAWPTDATAWLIENRRYLGVSFAVSHVVHLLAILALYDWSLRRLAVKTGAAALLLGGLGYVFVLAMAATSFDRTAAWLGPRRWRRLHTAGMYYLWTIFTISYVPRAIMESPAYAPLAVVAIAMMVLRIAHRPRRADHARRRVTPAQAGRRESPRWLSRSSTYSPARRLPPPGRTTFTDRAIVPRRDARGRGESPHQSL